MRKSWGTVPLLGVGVASPREGAASPREGVASSREGSNAPTAQGGGALAT